MFAHIKAPEAPNIFIIFTAPTIKATTKTTYIRVLTKPENSPPNTSPTPAATIANKEIIKATGPVILALMV